MSSPRAMQSGAVPGAVDGIHEPAAVPAFGAAQSRASRSSGEGRPQRCNRNDQPRPQEPANPV